MPNIFAYIALALWPLVALWLFRTRRVESAVVICVVASFLLLPEKTAFDLPAVPALDKVTIPNISVLLLALAFAPQRMRVLPQSRIVLALLVALFIGTPATMLTNMDALWYGPTFLPAQTLYDAFSALAKVLLHTVPLYVGFSLLGSRESHRMILQVLLFAGLAYSLLMAFEIRFSPQLHTWIYGFFPHQFVQQMRGDGFRPMVFLPHGLWTAFFAMTATVAAAALWRAAGPERSGGFLAATLWLFVILVFAKSFGSLLLALFLIPIVIFFGPRAQLRIAVALAVVAVAYPALRGAGLVPLETVLEGTESFSADRAGSLRLRVENEDMLLDRANERPLFGWGIWGRNRIYDEKTGEDLSITDGYWVILIGSYGWVGYIAVFGLLAWPVVKLWRTKGAVPARETTALALLLAINMIELLPNSTFPPWTWLIAGALLGSISPAESFQKAKISTVL